MSKRVMLKRYAAIIAGVVALVLAAVLWMVLEGERVRGERVRLASVARGLGASLHGGGKRVAEELLIREGCGYAVVLEQGGDNPLFVWSSSGGGVDHVPAVFVELTVPEPYEVAGGKGISMAVPLELVNGRKGLCVIGSGGVVTRWWLLAVIAVAALGPVLMLLPFAIAGEAGGRADDSPVRDEKVSDAQILQLGRLASLRQITSGIIHEMNQPLCIMKGYLGLLQMMAKDDEGGDPAAAEYIDTCLLNIDRAGHILEHIRKFSRDGAGEAEKVDCVKSLRNVLDFFGEQFGKRGIKLELKVPDTLPPVLMSPALLEQSMVALLANARDSFLAEGACREGRSVKVTLEGVRGSVVLTVEDNGAGMSREVLERCAEPFFSTSADNTGVGLALARIVASRYRGTLKVNSISGRGCDVILSFPIHREAGNTENIDGVA